MGSGACERNSLPETFASFHFPNVPGAFGLEVLQFVARVAERDAVVNGEAEFRVSCERHDMVSAQIAALRITASLTRETVAGEHGVSPRLVFWQTSIVEGALRRAVLVVRVVFTSLPSGRRELSRTNIRSFGRGARDAFLLALAPRQRRANLRSGLLGVNLTLEGGNAPLGGFTRLHSSTRRARGGTSIAARGVYAEKFDGEPFLTLRAVLLPRVTFRTKFFFRNTDTLRGSLYRTVFSLRHVNNITTRSH